MTGSWGACAVLGLLAAAVPIPSSAQQADAAVTEVATDAAFAIMEIEGFVDANDAFCAAAAPEIAEAVGRAVDQWHAVNATRFLWRWIEDQPELASGFATARLQREAEIGAAIAGRSAGREAEWCRNLSALLREAKWDIATSFAPEVATMRSLGALLGDEAASAPLQRGQSLAAIPAMPSTEALEAGWDPDTMPLPGEYRCYDESAATADHADLIVQITGPGTYASSFGGGTWGLQEDDFVWASRPFRDASTYVRFGEQGAGFSGSAPAGGVGARAFGQAWAFQDATAGGLTF